MGKYKRWICRRGIEEVSWEKAWSRLDDGGCFLFCFCLFVCLFVFVCLFFVVVSCCCFVSNVCFFSFFFIGL